MMSTLHLLESRAVIVKIMMIPMKMYAYNLITLL